MAETRSKEIDADINVEFEQTVSRQSLNSGEEIKTLFGKIKKFLTDLKAVAFSGSYDDLSDTPESLPANGGTADTARQVIGSSSKIKLYEDNEGGNLRLVAPDGVHFMEMDLYNNEQFRMYFDGGDGIVFPLNYDFATKKININGNADTVDGKHASDFVQLADEIILNNIRINANQHKIADINYRWSIWADDEGGNLEIKSPDGSRGIQFDCFDNNIFRIYTYVNGEYFGIIEMNHSTGEVTSNGNVISKKPYVTGTVNGWDVPSSATFAIEYTFLDFTPSFVIYTFNNGKMGYATPITNGFRIVIDTSSGTSATYIAFK